MIGRRDAIVVRIRFLVAEETLEDGRHGYRHPQTTSAHRRFDK